MGRGILRNGYPLQAGRMYRLNWIPPASGVSLERHGLVLVFLCMVGALVSRLFRVCFCFLF